MAPSPNDAKEQEKELRKQVIRQASNRSLGSRQDSNRSLTSCGKATVRSKKAPAVVPQRNRPKLTEIVRQLSNRSLASSSGDESDSDQKAKAQEKELRKQAIRQASNRSLNGPGPDLFAKEREKALRKHAIRQASNRSMNTSARSLNSSARSLNDSDPGMFAKEQEKAARKHAIRQASSRSMNTSGRSASPDLLAKEQEKERRKLAIRQASDRSLNVSDDERKPAAVAASKPSTAKQNPTRREIDLIQNYQRKIAPPKLAPMAPASPQPTLGAKDLGRHVREILETQDYPRKQAPLQPSPIGPLPDELTRLDQAIEAKNRELQIRKHGSSLDQEVEAKNREMQTRQTGSVPYGSAASLEEGRFLSQSERDTQAKLVAMGEGLGAVTPGASYCAIPLGSPPPGAYGSLPMGSPPPGSLREGEDRCQDMDGSAMADEEMGAGSDRFSNRSLTAGSGHFSTRSLAAGNEHLSTRSLAEVSTAEVSYSMLSDIDMTGHSHSDPIQETDKPEENNNHTDSSSTGSPSGLIQAVLVEDDHVVQATIATAQPADDLIRKQSAAETARVKKWRTIVCLALLVTGVAVTVSTYLLLVDREHKNFENVYYQFARTLGDAAVEQQDGLRKGLRMLSDTVSMTAETMKDENGTSPWPYFIMPRFEMLAADFKAVANAEFVGMQNYVEHDQRDSYIDFITERYQDFVKESHMQAYGNLNFLDQNTSLYQPYIAQKLENGSFVEEAEHDYYFCRTHQSPPARAYAPTINNNLLGNKVISDGFHAAMTLRSEPVFTTIKPFANLPDDEHAKMHSNGAEGANNPHSFTFQPIHEVPQDYSSRIVAMFAVATAWDFSMLNLLPDNVKGMYCIVENTCNQTVTYRVDGGNATYLGEGELHNHDFDHMAVFVDLDLQEHPNASTTPGHCQYSMRIFPSKDFASDYKTSTPAIYAAVVAGTFVMIGFMYLLYDLSVTRRNEKMISNAAKTNKILTKLVPENIRDRIMGFGDGENQDGDELDEQEWVNGINQMDSSRNHAEHSRRREMTA